MAQTEEVVLLEVKTYDAVKNVNDLKENIKALKHNLGLLDIGTTEYQDTLNSLKVSQNMLKDAMYATSGTFQDVIDGATGANKSYNALVHTMAALKEEWRATTDEAMRADLGQRIAKINQELKDMDASVGNFQRNVGNYESGVTGLVAKFDQWGGILKQMPPTLGAAKESIGKVGESMQLVGKQPILGIIGLLAPIIMKITASLKENETAMDAVKRLMASLQPIFDVLEKALEGIAQAISKAVDWFIKLVGESKGIQKVVSGIIGVGNAILQYMIAPVKAAVKAFVGLGNIMKDIFTGQFNKIKEDAKTAWEGIKDSYKEGFSFKSNYQEGQRVGADFIEGVKGSENKAKAQEAGKEIGKEMAKGVEEGLKLADVNKALKEGESKRSAEISAMLEQEKEIAALIEEEWANTEAEIEEYYENEAKLREKDLKDAEQKAKEKVDTLNGIASATSNLLASLADMYESDEKNSEKNAKKIKALRIASATIDMLQGAVGAYSSAAASIPPPAGLIVGAANAAAVIAMGVANINKIKSTSFSGGGVSPSASAVVSAPRLETSVQSVRNVTSASEEDRLNKMASSQKVYILQSDIEAAGNQSRVQVEESSF